MGTHALVHRDLMAATVKTVKQFKHIYQSLKVSLQPTLSTDTLICLCID